ncbi:hypothetical protein LEP1GSC096_0031 [Leptospira interrogans serovar Hebdomadis str. R499]|uniref:hypothetical protein n=1 Tax=Leptospira interrogans TaxID=173 RepID=UPI0002980F24|nr:hypothetical protein [Leptospira interrogans]EKR34345.1 hypothetical protein LEP1GSC096_0031 [Leptospira interrogans serovar Hebdomadis str. R499]MBE0302197.1 hypothetical protein [Leptospira interrogans serovar Yeoncheon]
MKKKTNNWWILVLPNISSVLSSPQNLLQAMLITNKLLPSDISDEKKSIFQDYPQPGLDYAPVDHVRNENTRITFTVPIVNLNKSTGNMLDLYAVERARSHQIDISLVTDSPQWKQNPTCIYSGWGTHRPPLPVIIEDIKLNHKRDLTNRNGFSQFTECTFTMRYLEDQGMYKMWKIVRNIGAGVGVAQRLSGRSSF